MISPIISLMLQCLLFPKLCWHICPSLQPRQWVYTLCTCTYIREKGVASRLWSQRKCCPGNCVGGGHSGKISDQSEVLLHNSATISNSESFLSTHSTCTWGSSALLYTVCVSCQQSLICCSLASLCSGVSEASLSCCRVLCCEAARAAHHTARRYPAFYTCSVFVAFALLFPQHGVLSRVLVYVSVSLLCWLQGSSKTTLRRRWFHIEKNVTAKAGVANTRTCGEKWAYI